MTTALPYQPTGNCFIDPEIKQLKDSNPSEAIDTGFIQLTFENGGNVTINVCRRATYGTPRPTVRHGVGRTNGRLADLSLCVLYHE